jgi:hypothetical protein
MKNPGYHIDLNEFSLAKFKEALKNTRLLPSQKVLGEHIEARFAILEQHGIENLAQLQEALKKKSDVQAFAEATGLPVDYLTILRREVNSYQPKPIKLGDFPGVNPEAVEKLSQLGIKHTAQLFPHVLTQKDRSEFAEENQIKHEDILELTKLTDIARTKWVGPKFARLMVESEYDTVEKIAQADHEELYDSIMRTNEEGGYYKGGLGKDDMKFWIKTVQEVPLVIRY